MEATDVAAILEAVAWPIAVLLIFLYFSTSIQTLLDQLARSLQLRSLKFNLFGQQVELTREEVKDVLDEILKDIVEALNELSPDEVALFQKINSGDGRYTVQDLLPDFKRESMQHAQLRKLRDRKLIRPEEGGNWQPQKHPIMTRFGRLVWQLRPKVSKQGAVT
jgi:hypothetical protein